MQVFINPGHALNGNPDPGACGYGLRESDVAARIGVIVEERLRAAGVETYLLQRIQRSSQRDRDMCVPHRDARLGSRRGCAGAAHIRNRHG